MPGPDTRRRPGSVVVACCAGLLTLAGLLLAAVSPARAEVTSWGVAGAEYSDGVLCRLPGETRVPMARWEVDGRTAFATADVIGTPSGDGPAPVGGPLVPMVAGQGGLDDRAIALMAYLLSHHGAGPPARTAEVSADVAAAFGGGDVQARCLGQHGTTVADAAALLTEAGRYAGPYRLDVAVPPPAAPGATALVSVTVHSATDVLVPDVPVTVSGAGPPVIARTTAQGVATVPVSTPAVAGTTVTATVPQPTGLLFAAGTPGAVAAAPPSNAVATAVLGADLHPHPVLRVDVGGGLVVTRTRVPVVARVAGTADFTGTGTVTLAGPARPGAGGACASLPASAFAAAPNAWSQAFSFTGDGAELVGSTPALAAGCYVAGGSITVDGAGVAATASAPFGAAAIIDVIPLSVRRSALPVLALPGAVSTTVTVDGADDATVTSTATVLGPVATRDGRCARPSWAGVRVLAAVSSGPHRPVDGDARSVVLRTPVLTAIGCYAVRTSTTIERDGHRLTVAPAPGAPETVVLVLRPMLTLTDDTYDTTLGTPMNGHVSVAGTYAYPALLTVRLATADPHFDGCRSVAFPPARNGSATATARTTGDGTFTFHTPAPQGNACYAVQVSLQMLDAAGVRVAGPAPTPSTVFLAGVAADVRAAPGVGRDRESPLRARLVLLVSALLMLTTAGTVVGAVANRFRTWPGRDDDEVRHPAAEVDRR